jgi:hypothetical protein
MAESRIVEEVKIIGARVEGGLGLASPLLGLQIPPLPPPCIHSTRMNQNLVNSSTEILHDRGSIK